MYRDSFILGDGMNPDYLFDLDFCLVTKFRPNSSIPFQNEGVLGLAPNDYKQGSYIRYLSASFGFEPSVHF